MRYRFVDDEKRYPHMQRRRRQQAYRTQLHRERLKAKRAIVLASANMSPSCCICNSWRLRLDRSRSHSRCSFRSSSVSLRRPILYQRRLWHQLPTVLTLISRKDNNIER